jgi:hypothetical protein
MQKLLERARAYLAGLEADRQAALALSEQKAEEAKLIKARQEGFQAAMELLGCEIPAGAATGTERELSANRSDHGERASGPEKPPRRRGRRPIREMILRELSFSGQAMTTAQIAKAIAYLPDRTEVALERMEKNGQVLRNEGGRWAIGLSSSPQGNGHADSPNNGKLPADA